MTALMEQLNVMKLDAAKKPDTKDPFEVVKKDEKGSVPSAPGGPQFGQLLHQAPQQGQNTTALMSYGNPVMYNGGMNPQGQGFMGQQPQQGFMGVQNSQGQIAYSGAPAQNPQGQGFMGTPAQQPQQAYSGTPAQNPQAQVFMGSAPQNNMIPTKSGVQGAPAGVNLS